MSDRQEQLRWPRRLLGATATTILLLGLLVLILGGALALLSRRTPSQ